MEDNHKDQQCDSLISDFLFYDANSLEHILRFEDSFPENYFSQIFTTKCSESKS
jgi:hypothetical protein